MTTKPDDIVFEDLHGVPDRHHVEVDLDADQDGIRRYSVEDDLDGEDGELDEKDDLAAGDPAADDDSDADDDSLAASEDDEEEDDQPPSSRNAFQKRLDRERRAKLKARREAADANRRAEEIERRLAEQSRTLSEQERKAIDDGIATAKRELKEAFENGDTDKQVELTERLSELNARKLVADRQKESSPPESGQNKSGVPDLARKWMSKNGDWFRQPGFERYTLAANRIDAQLYEEGYDVNSRDYYRELDKRLGAKFPDLFDDEKPGKRDGRSRSRDRRSTVASVDGASNDRASRRALTGKVELNSEDFAVMRAFGLDPNDPAHLKEFAASRRERLAMEGNRRGR
jgi:hypothetical protein